MGEVEWVDLSPYWSEMERLAEERSDPTSGYAWTRRWSPKSHFYGLLGEKCFSVFSGESVDTRLLREGDDGTDFEGVDVKTSTFVADPILKHPVWAKRWAPRYVLSVLDVGDRRGGLVGWSTGQELRDGAVKNFGYGDQRCLLSDQLRSMGSWG